LAGITIGEPNSMILQRGRGRLMKSYEVCARMLFVPLIGRRCMVQTMTGGVMKVLTGILGIRLMVSTGTPVHNFL